MSDPRKEPQGIPVQLDIHYVLVNPSIYQKAEQLLTATISCPDGLRANIRTVAKALIDEADEIKRATSELLANAQNGQLQTISPLETLAKAKSLLQVDLGDKDQQEKVRLVAKAYVGCAEANQKAYDEFLRKYGHLFPNRRDM